MCLKIFTLALGMCLVFGSAAAQQQQAPLLWQGNLSGGWVCVGCVQGCCCQRGWQVPCQKNMSVFTPNEDIVITRIEVLAIPDPHHRQDSKYGCSTAAVRLHEQEKTYVQYHLLPYIEEDNGVVYVDSGKLAVPVLIRAGTKLRMSFSHTWDCQIPEVKVTVQYQAAPPQPPQ